MSVTCSTTDSRELLLAHLRGELGRLEAGRRPADEQVLSSGSPALDRLLPGGGVRRGTLVEYLAAAPGSGAGTLALAAAREACGAGKALVVLDGFYSGSSPARPSGPTKLPGPTKSPGPAKSPGGPARSRGPAGYFYPPAAAAWGIDLSRLVVLRAASEADALWALDQALRCPGVGAVWARWDALEGRDFRRLQLAAEEGGAVGLLLRPATRRGHPTWADVQWLVQPLAGKQVEDRSARGGSQRSEVRGWRPERRGMTNAESWRLRVELVRCRGTAGGRSVVLELDETSGVWVEATDATNTLSEAAQLAPPTSARRA